MGTVVNAQNLLTKEELAAIEQADLANQAKLPTTRGRKFNSFQ